MASAPAEVRKPVTVMFVDVTGSTALGERLDPEAVRQIMTRYFDAMRMVLESHGGTVEKFIGDAVMAVFGIPLVHEDDALRAARAAAAMRRRLGELNRELGRDFGVELNVRTGINSGEAVVGGSGQTLVTGDPVNVAARLEQAAPPGEVLLGEVTYWLVRDKVVAEPVEPVAARGKQERVAAWRLVEVREGAGVTRRQPDTAFVGRVRELSLLTDAFERTASESVCSLVTILGSPGVGKTRLAEAFLTGLSGMVTVARGRCLSYGDGITYWPFVEMLTEAASLAGAADPDEVRSRIARLLPPGRDRDVVVERLAQVLGVAGALGRPEETFWALRRFLEAWAELRPLVVFIDDLHWAEPTLLDLIENVADWSRGAGLLLLVSARPELLDSRPGWGGGKRNATTMTLEQLSDTETLEIAEDVAGGPLPAELAARIATLAEGNPLFAEQTVAMLVERHALVRQDGAVTLVGSVDEIAVPATVTAVLAARLEQLPPAELTTLERAAVEGKRFNRGAVAALLPDDLAGRVAEWLAALERKDLIRPDAGALAGEDAFAFHHQLLRDAAYTRVPKQLRAELHERFAIWLEPAAAAHAVEFDEILGWHLEQAWRLLTELGPPDARARRLGVRASELLSRAGRRSAERGDAAGSIRLLNRAMAASDGKAPGRARLMSELSWPLFLSGDLAGAAESATKAAELAEAEGDRPAMLLARVRALFHTFSRGSDSARARLYAEELGGMGEDVLAADAFTLASIVTFWGGQASEATGLGERAIEFLRRAGGLTAQAAANLGTIIMWGPWPVASALTKIQQIRTSNAGGAYADALLTQSEAVLLAYAGRFEEAHSRWREGQTFIEELAMPAIGASQSMFLAELERAAGGLELAIPSLAAAVETLGSLDERLWRSTVAGYLAEALRRENRLDEAEAAVAVSRDCAAPNDWLAHTQWRCALAGIMVDRGQPTQAEALAREAVDVIEHTDYLAWRGGARERLAEALRALGRTAEARIEFGRALVEYEQKESIALSDRVKAALASLD